MQPTFHSTVMIPMTYAIIQGILESNTEQVYNLIRAKNKPSVLDDYTIKRIVQAAKNQKQDLAYYKKQCKLWGEGTLTDTQRELFKEIDGMLEQVEKTNQQLLYLAGYFKSRTIEKVLAKHPIELILDEIQNNESLFSGNTKFEAFVTKPDNKKKKPLAAKYKNMLEDYKNQRKIISKFQEDTFDVRYIPETVMSNICRELGVFYLGDNSIGTDNQVELGLIYQCCLLYSYINKQKVITNILDQFKIMSATSKQTLVALENAMFTIIKVEESYPEHGAMEILDLRTGNRRIMFDIGFSKAVNKTYIATSLVDLGEYVITPGSSVSFDMDLQGSINIMKPLTEYLIKYDKAKPSQHESMLKDCAIKSYRTAIAYGLTKFLKVNEVE